MIRVDNVSKTYKTKVDSVSALHNINLEIKEGELFGLIGPDGAGKTTLIRILTTLLLADEGKINVCGYDVVKDFKSIRNITGYMPGKFSLYMDLTIQENLEFFATIFNTTIQENYHLIKDIYTQIEPFKNRRAGQLSGGMKQKLALCCALIHKPQVLFLDEPTTGVDAVSRMEFWQMLQQLKKQSITILVSTPYMDEASMCDRIALIQSGNIMQVDTPKNITQNFGKILYQVKCSNMLSLLKELQKNSAVENVYAFGEYHHLILNSNENIDVFIQNIKKNFSDFSMQVVTPSIEDCFIDSMKKVVSHAK